MFRLLHFSEMTLPLTMEPPLSVSLISAEKSREHPRIELQISPEDIFMTAVGRFPFTVYESQCWWIGLDWTTALLPGERPSWCSISQAPPLPPVAFALPVPTMAFLSVDVGRRHASG